MNQRRIVTALVLSGILSVSSSITLLKSATAAPINSASSVTKDLKVSATSNLPRSVRNAVIRDLSRRQGILPSNISIVESTERNWRNGCLELAGPGELCTQALVPGWQVVASDGRNNFIYHTNNNGRNLRVTNRNIADNGNNTSLPSTVRDAVIRAASSRLRVQPRQLNITQARAREWRDGCLELSEPNRACSQVIVPGWRVVVGIKDVSLVYHTNKSGSIVRLNRTESDVNNKGLSDKAERAVLRAGANDTGLPASELEIGSVEQITVDGCLGLARPGEACTKIAQQAFRVTVAADKRRLVYHVLPDGSQVRLNLAASNIKLPQNVSDRILRRVSEGTGIPVAALSVVNIESGKWKQGRNSSYIWKVTVGNEQDRWVYLSNENGESLQLLAEGLPRAARNAVLSKAAQTAELPQKAFDIVSYKRKQWFFGCEDPGTLPACSPAPVSGWEVSVKPTDARDAWVYLVSDNGSQLKLVQGGRQDQVGSNVNIPINIADAVLRDASRWSGRSEDTFRITQAQKHTFSNSCSLTFNPVCDMSYRPIPGWKVTVDSGLGAWYYLVSADAKIVNQDQTPALAPTLAQVIKRDVLRRSSGKELADLRVTNIKLGNFERFDAEVTVSDGMQNWVYAVDKESTRFEYLPVASIPRAIVNSVLADAQKRAVAKVNVSSKNITGAEQVTWKNGNLGLDGSLNSSSSVKGWRITVAVGRERFVYHTNNFVGSASNKIAFRLNTDASRIVDEVANGGVPIPTRSLPPALTDGVIFRYVTTGGIIGRTYETVLLEDGRLIQTRLGDTNDSERRVFRLSQSEIKEFQQLLKRQAELFQNVTYPAPSGAADYITYTLTSLDGTIQYNDASSAKLPDNLKVVLKAWNDLTATTLSNR